MATWCCMATMNMQMCFLTILCSTFQEIFSQHFVACLPTMAACVSSSLLIQHLASTERSAITAWPRRKSEFLLNHAVQPYSGAKKGCIICDNSDKLLYMYLDVRSLPRVTNISVR